MKKPNVLKCGLSGLAMLWVAAAVGVAAPCGFDSWTASQPASRLLRAVEFGNGQFLAVGDEGVRLISNDGAAWSHRTGDSLESYTGATFADGLFHITGIRLSADRLSSSGIILSSPDGTSWTQRFVSAGFSIQDIVRGGGRYVAVAASSAVPTIAQAFTSTDGLQWTPSPIGSGFWPYSISHGNGVFVGVGADRVFRSLDGMNWSVDVAPNGWRLTAISFGPGGFTAVGIGGIIATSLDGTTWTAQPSPTTNDLWSVGSGGGYFAAAGNNGAIVISQNGSVWSLGNSTGPHLRGIASGTDRFVAAGWYGRILVSGQPCAPRLALHVGGTRQLQLWGPVGRRYRVEYAPTPHHPAPWPVLTEISSLPSSPYTIPDTTPVHPEAQFFRAALLP